MSLSIIFKNTYFSYFLKNLSYFLQPIILNIMIRDDPLPVNNENNSENLSENDEDFEDVNGMI